MLARSLLITFVISVLPAAAHAVEERLPVAKPLTNYEILENLNRIAFVDEYRAHKKRLSGNGSSRFALAFKANRRPNSRTCWRTISTS